VHDSVDSKSKRMIVRWRDCSSCSCTNVCKDYFARCVAAYGTEIGVVKRGLDRFVECGMETGLYCRG
jgi:hypothetical protein